jgi:hypothetical protein
MPRLTSDTEKRHLSNSAVYTNDVDSPTVLVTPVSRGAFRHIHDEHCHVVEHKKTGDSGM